MPQTLGSLIRSSPLSYAQIAAEAGIGKARVGQLAQDAFTLSPQPETIAGLARALGQPVQVVIAAVAASTDHPPADDIAARVASLPPSKRAVMDATLTALEQM